MRGVVYPLPEEGVADVGMVDESEFSLDALRRPAGLFTEATASSWGDAAGCIRVSIVCDGLALSLEI